MSVSDLDLPDYRDELEAEVVSFPAASKALLTTLLDQMDTAAIAAALQSDVPHLCSRLPAHPGPRPWPSW